MLPIGADLFGFDRVSEVENKREVRKLGFVNPDGFAIWIGNALSNKRFGGDNPLATAKPDYLIDLYGARDSTQTEDMHFVPPKAIDVTKYWFTDRIDQVKHAADGGRFKREFATESAGDAGTRFFVARVIVKMSAAPKDKPNIRFRLPQFRLFGSPPIEGGGVTPKCYLGIGMTDLYSNKEQGMSEIKPEQVRRLVRFNPQTNFILGDSVTKPVAVKEANEAGNEQLTGFEFDVAFVGARRLRPVVFGV